MNVKSSALAAVLVIAAAVPATTAGPIAYGICQTGCNAVAVACYAGAGAVMGTVTAGVRFLALLFVSPLMRDPYQEPNPSNEA
ncbi:hypothetical protein ACG7TL_004382 [Trametes sanguinea]